MYCSDCGAEVDGDQTFCPECGENLHDEEENQEQSSESESPIWAKLPGLSPAGSRGRNIIVGAVYVLLLVVILAAAGGGGADGSGPASNEITVVVEYSGEWSGAVGSAGNTRSVSGSGTTELDVDQDASIVSANAQKRDGGGGELTIKIMRGDEVLEQSSTSSQYGVAQVSTSV